LTLATKRKSKRKTSSKKNLEAKIAELEGKLSKISAQMGQKPAEQAKAAPPPPPKAAPPPPPKAAPPPPPKAQPPKPSAKAESAPPATLESFYESVSVGIWHNRKTKTPGYVDENPRAWARRHATGADCPTTPWALQKTKVPGYTAPSNKYFATRQRLAFHPHNPDKNFQGYGISLGHGTAQVQTQSPPPPPPPQQQSVPKESASSGGSKKADLEAYERDYLARLDAEATEAVEIQRAAEELAAKRNSESGGSSQTSSTHGSLPKGF